MRIVKRVETVLEDSKVIETHEKEIKIFKFDELEEDVKEAVLNERRYMMVEDTWWYDDILEEFKKNAEKIGYEFEIKDITFNLFSQGSHLSFNGSLDLHNFIKRKNYKIRLGLEDEVMNCLYCDIKEYGKVSVGMHHHTNYDKIDNYISLISEELEEDIKNEVYWFLKHWKNVLENEYYNLTSDNMIKSIIDEDDIWFYSNGEVYLS
jgi:hypothetical protein